MGLWSGGRRPLLEGTPSGYGGVVTGMGLGYSLMTSMRQDVVHDWHCAPLIKMDGCSYPV